MRNVIILGSGIAGLTAALYTARANLNPLVISGNEPGGQLTITTLVENYPGFVDGVQGPHLMSIIKEQAKKFGTEYLDENVISLTKKGKNFIVKTDSQEIETKSVIIATGASARKLDIPSEGKYWARGVHTCATCDGYFYKDKEVIVIGGGDSAAEESLFLSNVASKVTIIHRRDKLRASKIMQDRILKNKKINIIWNSEVIEVIGDNKKVTSVKLKDNKNKITELKTNALFLAIGHIPNTDFLKSLINLNENGFIIADKRMHTNIPGIFAAGDVQDVIYKQAVTAAGSGCQAALEVERYLGELT
ncbi:MAG TPA: thioredoxin-disulfide reductase [Candidatus Nanoarchaeia archaeon]|nr:thioredoxin-disulfide reductase [Candidatus Nanoarchaeia archaeon]